MTNFNRMCILIYYIQGRSLRTTKGPKKLFIIEILHIKRTSFDTNHIKDTARDIKRTSFDTNHIKDTAREKSIGLAYSIYQE